MIKPAFSITFHRSLDAAGEFVVVMMRRKTGSSIFFFFVFFLLLTACDPEAPTGGSANQSGPTAIPEQISWQSSTETISATNAGRLRLIGRLEGHASAVDTLSFSPDGTRLASGSTGDSIVNIWDMSSGEVLTTLLSLSARWFFWGSTTDIFITAGRDQIIRQWDLTTQTSTQVNGAVDTIGAMAQSPDGKHLVVGGRNGRLQFLTIEPLTEQGIVSAHAGYVSTVLFTPDSQQVISMSGEISEIKIWDVQTRELVHNFGRFSDALQQIALTSDGNQLVIASRTKIEFWSLQTYTLIRTLESGKDFPMSILRFSPDGAFLAANAGDTVLIWNLASGNLFAGLPEQQGSVTYIIYSADGKMMMSNTLGPEVYFWNLEAITLEDSSSEAKVPPVRAWNLVGESIRSLELSPDGKTLIFADINGSVFVLGIPAS